MVKRVIKDKMENVVRLGRKELPALKVPKAQK